MPWASSDRKSRLPNDWAHIRLVVLARDGYHCRLRYSCCVLLATDVDHVIAGDDHRIEALQSSCGPCHAVKSSREGHAAKPKRRRPAERHPGMI